MNNKKIPTGGKFKNVNTILKGWNLDEICCYGKGEITVAPETMPDVNRRNAYILFAFTCVAPKCNFSICYNFLKINI